MPGFRFRWTVVVAAVVIPRIAAAQERALTGTVTGAVSRGPVAEAVVALVGGRATASTDAAGRFAILVPASEVHLQVRAIGYARKDVTVPAGDTSVTIVLKEDAFQLDAVVVSGQATEVERRF